MYTHHSTKYTVTFPCPAPTHSTPIHVITPSRSTCKASLNKQTHSFFFSFRKYSPFPTEPLMTEWCVKCLSQSVCPEAPSVLSDAHRLPWSRDGVGGNSERRIRKCLKRPSRLLRSSVDCGGGRQRDKN